MLGRKMKALSTLAAAVLAAFLLNGCQFAKWKAEESAVTEQWLNSHPQRTAKIDLNGNWFNQDWGIAQLTQKGNKVEGTLGDFTVTGKVSGYRAYLALQHGGWTHYTAVARRKADGTLEIAYSEGPGFDRNDVSTSIFEPLWF